VNHPATVALYALYVLGSLSLNHSLLIIAKESRNSPP
jgi:hypothetical protein